LAEYLRENNVKDGETRKLMPPSLQAMNVARDQTDIILDDLEDVEIPKKKGLDAS
jgi:hypothetical protein